jgi:hypothetical protein
VRLPHIQGMVKIKEFQPKIKNGLRHKILSLTFNNQSKPNIRYNRLFTEITDYGKYLRNKKNNSK